MKEETLLALLDKLDEVYAYTQRERSDPLMESGCGCAHVRAWPRLRDSILDLTGELNRVKMVVGEVDFDLIEALLARLDKWEPQK